jgi:hypothetical protein|tara:strand:+ start:275 stop:568 length:294 start_codon:yes stop_codon:yes gene_type:complete
LIFPVKVLSKKLSLSKVSPLIKTLSKALYNIDELSIKSAVTEKIIKYFRKILPVNLAIEKININDNKYVKYCEKEITDSLKLFAENIEIKHIKIKKE